MNSTTRDSAVSSIISVILVIAVTVAISVAVGVFVFDLGESDIGSTQQELGVKTSQSGGDVSVQVVTGEADELQVLVNGSVEDTFPDPSPGDELSVPVNESDDVSVVSVSEGDKSVISRDVTQVSSGLSEAKSNSPPTAIARVDNTHIAKRSTVQFNGSESSDPDDGGLSYEWDFGDESINSTEDSPAHTYDEAGEYTAVLTVEDDEGRQDSDSVTLTVEVTAPNDGLVAHWTFNEGEGSTAYDEAGSTDGTISSNATWDSNSKGEGYAVDLNGSKTAYVQNTTNGSLNISQNVTLSAWVYVRGEGDKSWNRYVSYDDTEDNHISLYWDANDDRHGFVYKGKGNSTMAHKNSSITQERWVHLVGTYNGSTVQFYQDGVQIASESNMTTFDDSSAKLTVGQRSDIESDYTNALIGEVRAYDRALSSEGVEDLHEATR